MTASEFGFNEAEAVVEAAEEKETGRIEAFSDGVFAIAVTLLVLEIRPPEGESITDGTKLWAALGHEWPHYLAFVLGFGFVAIMWMNHHMLFSYIRRSSHGLLLLNSLLLMMISFFPFPVALVAAHIGEPDSEMARVSMMVFSGVGILTALCFGFLWRHMSTNNRLINRRADSKEVQAVTQSYFFGPVLYTICLILAFFNAPASLVLHILIGIFFALPGKVQGSLAGKAKRKA